jgi:hypothetical protein
MFVIPNYYFKIYSTALSKLRQHDPHQKISKKFLKNAGEKKPQLLAGA